MILISKKREAYIPYSVSKTATCSRTSAVGAGGSCSVETPPVTKKKSSSATIPAPRRSFNERDDVRRVLPPFSNLMVSVAPWRRGRYRSLCPSTAGEQSPFQKAREQDTKGMLTHLQSLKGASLRSQRSSHGLNQRLSSRRCAQTATENVQREASKDVPIFDTEATVPNQFAHDSTPACSASLPVAIPSNKAL